MRFTKLFPSVRILFRRLNFGNVTRSYSTGCAAVEKKGAVVCVYRNNKQLELTPCGQEVDQLCGGKISQQLNTLACELRLGKSYAITDVMGYSAVAIACIGPREAGYNPLESLDEARENIRWGVGSGVKLLKDRGCSSVEVDPCTAPDAAAEAAELAAWGFDVFKTENCRPPCRVSAYAGTSTQKAAPREWLQGAVRARAQNWARCLSDMPANKMTPVDLAQAAIDTLCELGVHVEAHDREWLEAQSMRAFLCVARGSCDTPVLLECVYRGAAPDAAPVLLAAKGVTFDSGGLCLKECQSMTENRGSMAGAAVVLAAFEIIAKLKLPINVVGVIPICENMVSGQCMKVGDVVKALNGLSIQIENTDMEGRLMMADALVYGQSVYKPSLVIDVATFTQGVLMATGGGAFGCFSNSEKAWRAVQCAGAASGDRPWRFPLWNYFHKQITNDPSVDLRNKGSGHATPCLGAAFLKNFVRGDWVHMDITGVGKVAHSGAPPYLDTCRMTGRPTRTLAIMIQQIAFASSQPSIPYPPTPTIPPCRPTGPCLPTIPPCHPTGPCPSTIPPCHPPGLCSTTIPPCRPTGPCLPIIPPCHPTGPCPTKIPPCHPTVPCPTTIPPCRPTGPCPTTIPPCHPTGPCPSTIPPCHPTGPCPSTIPPCHPPGPCPTTIPPCHPRGPTIPPCHPPGQLCQGPCQSLLCQGTGQSPPCQGESSTYQGKSPPCQGESPPCQGQSPTCQGEWPPCQGESPPCQGESQPCQGQSQPFQGQSQPYHGQSQPCHGQSQPCQREWPPCQGQSQPCQSEWPPCQGQSQPCQGQSQSCQGQSQPCQGQSQPCQAERPPCQGPSPSCQGQPQSCQGQSQPCQEQSPSCQREWPPCQGQSQPCQGDSQPYQGQSQPCQGESQPCQGQSQTCQGQSQLCQGQSQPCQGEWPPCQGQSQPCQGQSQPCQSEWPPCQGQSQPYQGQSQLCQGKRQPCQGQSQPCQGQSQPCQGQSPPCQGEWPPCQGQSQPCQGESQPCQGQSQLCQGQSQPCRGTPCHKSQPSIPCRTNPSPPRCWLSKEPLTLTCVPNTSGLTKHKCR